MKEILFWFKKLSNYFETHHPTHNGRLFIYLKFKFQRSINLETIRFQINIRTEGKPVKSYIVIPH